MIRSDETKVSESFQSSFTSIINVVVDNLLQYLYERFMFFGALLRYRKRLFCPCQI